MNKVKAAVHRVWAAKYPNPPKGGFTKAAMAELLECSEDKVNDVLRDAIKEGLFEIKPTKVYDKALEAVKTVPIYFEVEKATSSSAR